MKTQTNETQNFGTVTHTYIVCMSNYKHNKHSNVLEHSLRQRIFRTPLLFVRTINNICKP